MSRTYHARKPREKRVAWRYTSEGLVAYSLTRRMAQTRANETGMDHGLEASDIDRAWRYFALPARQYRCGHELRCEVVYPERLEVCLPGHGPVSRDPGTPRHHAPGFPGMRRERK